MYVFFELLVFALGWLSNGGGGGGGEVVVVVTVVGWLDILVAVMLLYLSVFIAGLLLVVVTGM